jgi:hypothetical protein
MLQMKLADQPSLPRPNQDTATKFRIARSQALPSPLDRTVQENRRHTVEPKIPTALAKLVSQIDSEVRDGSSPCKNPIDAMIPLLNRGGIDEGFRSRGGSAADDAVAGMP